MATASRNATIIGRSFATSKLGLLDTAVDRFRQDSKVIGGVVQAVDMVNIFAISLSNSTLTHQHPSGGVAYGAAFLLFFGALVVFVLSFVVAVLHHS